LINCQRNDAKHQMAEHLGVATYAHVASTELILETGIDAIGGGAFVVAHILGELVARTLPASRLNLESRRGMFASCSAW
jgi:hypothetical protein